MWAIAVGLDNALTRIQNNDTSGCEDVPGSLVPLEDFEYDNSKMGCVLRESYHETNFSGVTVSFGVSCGAVHSVTINGVTIGCEKLFVMGIGIRLLNFTSGNL